MKLQTCFSVICLVGVINTLLIVSFLVLLLLVVMALVSFDVGLTFDVPCFDKGPFSFVLIICFYAWRNLLEESFGGTLSSKIFSKYFLIKSNIFWIGLCKWNFEWKLVFILPVISSSLVLTAFFNKYILCCFGLLIFTGMSVSVKTMS